MSVFRILPFFVWRIMKNYIKKNWYFIIIAAITLTELITFLFMGKAGTYVGIHDNLDIHITD